MTNEKKILITILVIALLSLFELLVNCRRKRRIRQLPLIPLSLLASGIGAYYLTIYYDRISEIINFVPELLNSEILVINTALLLGYCIIRLPLILLCHLFSKNKNVMSAFSLDIYSYSDEYGEWFLKKQWVNYRKYLLALVCTFSLLTGAYLSLTWVYGQESAVWLMSFPAASIAVFGELFNFINGQTKEEFEHSVMGDDADARRVGSFYKLREVFERLLPEPLLYAYSGSEFMKSETPVDLIKEMNDSPNTIDRVVAEYFEIDNRYKKADIDCFQATVQLMHNQNVVFLNPFYRNLGDYITLPIATTLLGSKKCLVLCGRNNSAEDVRGWISGRLQDYFHMRAMWRTEFLSDKGEDCEVGILTFTQIYDKRVISANRDFFKAVDFVILIEPSVMLDTSQIALSIIAHEMERYDHQPTYCIIDRNVDGLVDTLSHVLHTEITNVVAPPVPRCNYTAMAWNADGDFKRQQLFDKQTRYLGNGVELAAIAIKNQIPKAIWYSETKSPIKDVKWITGQFYSTICKYMNLPSQQKSIYEKVDFVSNIWGGEAGKERFIIAEDEVNNMFSTMRSYLSQGTEQVFVNVLSENYLLRDYMRCNRQMFVSNPHAIPSLAPGYSKTERNTILKLVLMMSLRPVTDAEVSHELHLAGLDADDVFEAMATLLVKYTYADSSIITVKNIRSNVDALTTVSTYVYSITDEVFERYFSDSLRNAYYILEAEKDNDGYIDAKLFGHVTQTILPGQFVTYDGKYYQAKHISPRCGVVLRRASDLYSGRKYYRQIRTYLFEDSSTKEVLSTKKVGDITFTRCLVDFTASTSGYLEMDDSHNLRTARIIDFSEDPSVGNYVRSYHNKSVLCVSLPESDDAIRFTICMLLSEAFKSVFPYGWQYITATAKRPDDIDGMLNYMVYQISGAIDEEQIYIIEDSDVDLGLLDAVESNFVRFMEILADYLDWHIEKMREPASKDPVPVSVAMIEREEQKKRSLVVKMLDRIRRLFGGKKEENVEVPTPEKVEEETAPPSNEEIHQKPEDGDSGDKDKEPQPTPEEGEVAVVAPIDETANSDSEIDDAAESNGDMPGVESDNLEKETAPSTPSAEMHPEDELEHVQEADADILHVDGTDIFEDEGVQEDNDYLERSFEAIGLSPITKSRYQRECFLKFGYEEIDGRIHVDELRRYLRVRGWSNNSLTQARKRVVFDKSIIDVKESNCCDFCGIPLSGVSYERLSDGRVRCNDCSSTAISNVNEFKELFVRTIGMMEEYFNIRYRVPIAVKTADARTVAKGVGMIFKPSVQYAARVLGYAQKKNGKYSLIVENGSPRLATIDTMVHELTHIWQYLNWDNRMILQVYGMQSDACTARARDIVYEGMAMWASVQYCYQIGETYYASQMEALAEKRTDVYGVGFRLFAEQYPFIRGSELIKYSPFESFPPLEPQVVKLASKAMCREKNCIC